MVAHLAHLTRKALNILIINTIQHIECAHIHRATAQMVRGMTGNFTSAKIRKVKPAIIGMIHSAV